MLIFLGLSLIICNCTGSRIIDQRNVRDLGESRFPVTQISELEDRLQEAQTSFDHEFEDLQITICTLAQVLHFSFCVLHVKADAPINPKSTQCLHANKDLTLFPRPEPQTILIHQTHPNNDPNTIAVKMPAPALSPVVMGLVNFGSATCEGLSPLLPAAGFPLLVPPLAAVTGGETFEIRFAWMTLRADICSPTPYLPSQVFVFHVRPQVEPSLPPLHWPAAPCALS